MVVVLARATVRGLDDGAATTGAGACYLRPNGAASGTGQMYVNSAGALVASGNITAFSDRRVKKNIRPIEGALSKLLTLNGYTFDRTDLDAPRQTGVIAQEVMKVFPELVSHDQEADKYTVAYGNFAGAFIEAFKEEDAKVEALKKELNETKEVLAKVLARLEVLEK